jgi:hypothetical protein
MSTAIVGAISGLVMLIGWISIIITLRKPANSTEEG